MDITKTMVYEHGSGKRVMALSTGRIFTFPDFHACSTRERIFSGNEFKSRRNVSRLSILVFSTLDGVIRRSAKLNQEQKRRSTMKYIYTTQGCMRSEKLKKEYRDQNIDFVERDVSRLKDHAIERDDIDVEAYVELSLQSMILPIEVERR